MTKKTLAAYTLGALAACARPDAPPAETGGDSPETSAAVPSQGASAEPAPPGTQPAAGIAPQAPQAGHGEGEPSQASPAGAHGDGHGDNDHGDGHDHGHGDGDGHGHGEGHGHQGPLVHRFENAEDWADHFDAPDRDGWQKPQHVMELMAIEPGMTVADLGTGTGYFVPHLARAVGPEGQVLALDIEPDMVRYVRERAAEAELGNVTAREVAVDDPQLEPGSVDRVLIVDTWHHIPDRSAYVAKLAAGLRPGGSVVVVDFTPKSKKGPPKRHRVKAAKVAKELAAGGLEAEVLKEKLPEQYVVVGRLP